MIKNIIIRKAKEEHAEEIHKILSNAFSPYIQFYTAEAYNATVVSSQIIKERIHEKKITLLIAVLNDIIIATVTFQKEQGGIYLSSMAVDPAYQHKGIGRRLLDKIIEIAIKDNMKIITIDTYHPLEDAIRFYKSFGFRRTGETKEYHGIEVFEMIKELKYNIN